jgi:hypothetical protein
MPGSVAIDKALFDEMVGNAISNALKVRACSLHNRGVRGVIF